MSTYLYVPMVPRGKKSAMPTPNGHMTKHPVSRKWEAMLASRAYDEFQRLRQSTMGEGPIQVDILIAHARPRRLDATVGRGKNKKFKFKEGLIWHDKKPDMDNVRKSVQDALAFLWRDDAQVVLGVTLDFYAERDAPARVEVRYGRPPTEEEAIKSLWAERFE